MKRDFQWLAFAVALVAVVFYKMSYRERRSLRHWWQRRADGREAPVLKVVLALLPGLLLLIAVLLWFWSVRRGTRP